MAKLDSLYNIMKKLGPTVNVLEHKNLRFKKTLNKVVSSKDTFLKHQHYIFLKDKPHPPFIILFYLCIISSLCIAIFKQKNA